MARRASESFRLSIPVTGVPKEFVAALKTMTPQRRRALLVRVMRAGLDVVGSEIEGLKPGVVAGPFRGFIRWL